MNSKYTCWVGKRESDIIFSRGLFDGSITFYGSNSNENHSYYREGSTTESYSSNYYEYVSQRIDELYEEHNHIELVFYNPSMAFRLNCRHNILNDADLTHSIEEIIHWQNSKALCRSWLSNFVTTPDYAVLSKDDCEVKQLSRLFPNYDTFVVQKDISSGGTGTHKLSNTNQHEILASLTSASPYLVSPFYANIESFNSHIVVFANGVMTLPVSKQLIIENDSRFIYAGNTFGYSMKEQLQKEIFDMGQVIGAKLQKCGYRGICGLDFLVSKDKVMLQELNPRFQGSSMILDFELQRHHYPSLFALHKLALSGANCTTSEIAVPVTSGHLCIRSDLPFPLEMEYYKGYGGSVFADGYSDIDSERRYFFRVLFPNATVLNQIVTFSRRA